MIEHQCEQSGEDEITNRPEAERLQCVDLLGDLHRPELGGERRAGAPADDDRRHQWAQLADDGETDEVRDEDVGAELLELHGPLKRHDEAHEEVDEHDDRNGVGPRAVHDGQHGAPVRGPRLP